MYIGAYKYYECNVLYSWNKFEYVYNGKHFNFKSIEQ